ncbi:Hypothetical protein PHPALM_14706 [Phytophthora palmivora]|uniref:Uncharacterized protein n=1 Tax=Phytophthora palmivora TaxID=4796 RepID=A0A2P4XU46_9STRA|nr:Hypothetical protein PHPALM_14706 [Phytophthora palmivora]
MAQSHLHLTDRVSVESLPKLRPDDTSLSTSYVEVESPIDPIRLEDGSLCVQPKVPCPPSAGRTSACSHTLQHQWSHLLGTQQLSAYVNNIGCHRDCIGDVPTRASTLH